MGSAMSTPNVAARTSPALVMTPPVLARAAVTAGIRRLATERNLWAFGGSAVLDTPGLRGLELTVGEATLAFTAAEVADVVRELLPRG